MSGFRARRRTSARLSYRNTSATDVRFRYRENLLKRGENDKRKRGL